ncbi:Stf0 family sulfotransferase [Roseovarius nanhaiticus]|uniref:Stf0 family sulfotransferase n=1 Tax=Roseovarius nanhaiticus TaxID=573024 RepID=UPI00248FE052|nr:Stf0 family sulfotransferase [Roseovarius nanhaiticus]
MDSYIICGTPRTGSTLLCDLLASTQVAGNPDSFFMKDVDPFWAERWALPVRNGVSDKGYCAAYLKAVIAAGSGQTSIFGLRLMIENLDDLTSMSEKVYPDARSDMEGLQFAFGEILYIHLTREDKLAQAISMVKAEQTGLWHIGPDGTELERLAQPEEPRYQFNRIASKIEELERFDAAWLNWFDEQGIIPLRITYETLSQSSIEAVGLICTQSGCARAVA